MSRATIAGATDYTVQSFDDILADLEQWVSNLQEGILFLNQTKKELERKGYWKSVPSRVIAVFEKSMKFFETSLSELSEINNEIEKQVENNHVKRVRRVANTAIKLEEDMRFVWNDESGKKWQEYGTNDFYKMERMYGHAQDMLIDMFDLDNLTERLQDFVGKTWRESENLSRMPLVKARLEFVDVTRIEELERLQSARSSSFDLSRLIRFCKELNACYAQESFFAVAMLVRAILDHVPPIFGYTSFTEVANNYKGSKSFKQAMLHLNNSSRKIADMYLHSHIRKVEDLPNKTQVNFSSDVDILLGEIIARLKGS